MKKVLSLLLVVSFMSAMLLTIGFHWQCDVTFYAYKNTASVNSGQVANTTSLFGSAQTIISDTSTSSALLFASFDTWPCVPTGGGGQGITIQPENIIVTGYVNANTTLSSGQFEAQAGMYAARGTGSGTILFGGAYSESETFTTTVTKYTIDIPVSTATVIPAGYVINFAINVNPGTTHVRTVTLSFGSATDDANFGN